MREPHDLRIRQRWLLLPVRLDRLLLRPACRRGVDGKLRGGNRPGDDLAVPHLAVFDYFASLDLLAIGAPVSWAGPAAAPVWLDVAREFTERWHHQQHIRDVVGQPGQTERRFLQPVLATFAHSLPVALQDTDAPPGTVAHLHVDGEAGGDWCVAREHAGWQLYVGVPEVAAARVDLEQGAAWRLYTKGISPGEARTAAMLTGDQHLAQKLLEAVAIIAWRFDAATAQRSAPSSTPLGSARRPLKQPTQARCAASASCRMTRHSISSDCDRSCVARPGRKPNSAGGSC